MSDTLVDQHGLCTKIARLVEERGWNQEDFARLADLNRLTVRSIFLNTPRRLHNATVAACARALGLTVHELRDVPLETLLTRTGTTRPAAPEPAPTRVLEQVGDLKRDYELATQPELKAWAEKNPDRAAQLDKNEWDELLSLQGTGGPLSADGVEHYVEQIERRRRLVEKVATIAGTDYVDLLEQLVEVLYTRIQPYRDRI